MSLDLMLSAILILAVLYIAVWIRGPHEGKMATENRLLRHAKNFWRNRARKKQLVLVALLALFLLPIANPSLSSIPAARGNEIQEASFFTAADGDESTESLTSFSETTDDDWLYYPDGGPHLEDYAGDMDAPDWTAKTAGVTLTQSNPELEVDIVLSTTQARQWYMNLDGYATPGSDFHLTFWYKVDVDTRDLRVYIRTAADGGGDANGDVNFNPAAADTWYYGVVNVSSGSTAAESVLFSVTNYDPAGNLEVRVKDFQVWDIWEQHTGYLENFMDVSDWNAFYHSEISTDGDVANITCNLATYGAVKSTNAEGWVNYTVSAGDYAEIRLLSTSTAQYYFRLYYDNGGTTGDWIVWAWSGTYGTRKAIISNNVPVGAVIYEVRFYIKNMNQWILPDYLRIGPSDEMGWQHDGSTTAACEDGGAAYDNWPSTYSSDGDALNITHSRSGGTTAYSTSYLNYDTTATKADIETDYYPMMEINWSISGLTGDGASIMVYVDGKCSGGASERAGGAIFTENRGWTVDRMNIAALSGSSGNVYLRFLIGGADGQAGSFLIGHVKFYSIANNTLTQSGVGVDDYLYVDSGVLHSHIDDGYIELNHDPALSVSDTYSVYNLTTSGTAPQFSQYVSSWSTYSDDTRGATTSGTVTDIKLKFDSTEVLSAIKFIEDGTAPLIVRSSANPPGPDDDEGVVLKAVVDDAVEVYTVKFNAIVYPDGFSDVDYDATEQTDNLWMYSFSSLDAGNYTFKVIASDGANTNALTEYAYIDFVVREAVIIVEEITLIGAGEDFSMMTFSARINKDCSYTIYEESASSAESDTHTGSVTAPSFNLAWTKLDGDDANVNFTIKFTSGSLTYNYTSQYQVAQTTFYVDAGQVEGLDTVTVAGRISKLGAWQLYDENNEFKDSGSITELDFTIRFTKWSGYDEQDHDFAIKFTNGSQNCWYNSSFYAFKKPAVAAVVTTDKNILYAYQASFWTAIGIGAVIVMLAIDLYRKWK